MKTVKEVSKLTGISVRTLHYYDEIGLFRPTEVKETGYRFYDDKAIDKLGQILVFRELDLPLADIKLIMDNPNLDRNTVLAKQREMLCAKSQRIERIIASIDEMLKGDQNMDYLPYDDDSGYEARFYTCGICALMKEYGFYDLVPAMCHLDYTMSELSGASDFVREYTLASGSPYCDCGYKKKGLV